MTEFRALRSRLGLRQAQFATLLGVSLESCRVWDSGRREVPAAVLARARDAVANFDRDHEPLTLQQLADELEVNVHTLRDAARDGRLAVQFQKRSIFGRPARRVMRIEGREFLRNGYGRRRGTTNRSCPLIVVPNDYSRQLKRLRRRLGLTLNELAKRIGAANKAVIYQWESRKRRPSPVLWLEVHRLIATGLLSDCNGSIRHPSDRTPTWDRQRSSVSSADDQPDKRSRPEACAARTAVELDREPIGTLDDASSDSARLELLP